LGDGIEREHRFLGNSESPTIDINKAQDVFMRQIYYSSPSDFNPAKRSSSNLELLEEQKKKHTKLLMESPLLKGKSPRERLKKKLLKK